MKKSLMPAVVLLLAMSFVGGAGSAHAAISVSVSPTTVGSSPISTVTWNNYNEFGVSSCGSGALLMYFVDNSSAKTLSGPWTNAYSGSCQVGVMTTGGNVCNTQTGVNSVQFGIGSPALGPHYLHIGILTTGNNLICSSALTPKPFTVVAPTCVAGWSEEFISADTWAGEAAGFCDNTSYGACAAGTVTGSHEPSVKGSIRACCRADVYQNLVYMRSCPSPALGTVNVSSNIASSWTINGPETITGSGRLQASPSKKTGTYTITWNDVAGYTTPASQSLTLTSGATITFYGEYVPYVCTGTVPTNATAYAAPDNTGLTANTAYMYSATDTATKCQYNCSSGYIRSGSSCVASATPTIQLKFE